MMFWNRPSVSTIITLLTIFTGLFGSIHGLQLIEHFPFTSSFDHNTGEVIFWMLAILTSTIYFLHQSSKDKQRDNLVNHLINAVSTIPPKDFLLLFHRLYLDTKKVIKNYFDTSEETKKEDIEALIRLVLNALLTLVNKFDRANDGTQYGLNIMIFQDFSKKDINPEKYKNNILFIENETDINKLHGVLELNIQFSVSSISTDESNNNNDANLRPITLPIPKESKVSVGNNYSKTLSRVLPGAPIAFVENKMSRFTDSTKIVEWCENEGDFTFKVKTQIEQYFCKDNYYYMKSFLSLPLPNYSSSMKGVLNIHSNQKGLLENENIKQFIIIVDPFLQELINLIDVYYLET